MATSSRSKRASEQATRKAKSAGSSCFCASLLSFFLSPKLRRSIAAAETCRAPDCEALRGLRVPGQGPLRAARKAPEPRAAFRKDDLYLVMELLQGVRRGAARKKTKKNPLGEAGASRSCCSPTIAARSLNKNSLPLTAPKRRAAEVQGPRRCSPGQRGRIPRSHR